MYQETLDALNAQRTTLQHLNAMRALFERASDPELKTLIADVCSVFERWLNDMKQLVNKKNQNPVSKKITVAKVKASRMKKFIPSQPMADGKMLPSVALLIAYCNSKV
ncbi:hypothetical protein KAM644c_15920 [Klebsiella quasipneumoniae subsp. quasipneumoniae]|uniref:Uncharacterized protein n=1 Tax=Klebsiella quasipneumoniae subsp. quasipneumoniae TaxID=1667327 RepID=A0AAN1Y3X1_9ENTR|nr:hypothetical protein [Klebsiella quasipneumoniae]BDO12526.1 hypothetical protein KAM644c_15920 [Klebsiella quasipneumoniae subsp. quasipneumoniae]BDO18499.1 hypothetical protein KAM645c_15890 [Klebsiella quasipneumoniae subsp. quasipneumoniae]HBR1854241.1 hypothetical protein [Klebsiella quasipneumoniae subsp. quasipneumoniae]HDZ9039138.1 hypothetical protein [Klebsiella pneumoniae]